MQEHEVIFESFLERKGLKLTQPRKLILNTVFNLHEHFDIEQLYDIIHKDHSEVSRATVYRLIPLLVESGLIQKSVRGDTRDKYEHIFGHTRHAHWVCKECGTVIETVIQRLMKLLQYQAKEMRFSITDTSLELRGVCSNCNKKRK